MPSALVRDTPPSRRGINGAIYIPGQFPYHTQGHAGFGVTKNNLAYVEVYLPHAKDDFEPCVRLFAEYMGEH